MGIRVELSQAMVNVLDGRRLEGCASLPARDVWALVPAGA